MSKMRETKVTKANGSKVAKAANNSYIDANGVKITICKPVPNPKGLTARCHG